MSKVVDREATGGRLAFDVEGLAGADVRPEVARAVVQAGWNLLEMKSSTTLEEVFIELTGADQACAPATGDRWRTAMRNVWTICRRELYSYFVSPIAWVLLALFAVFERMVHVAIEFVFRARHDGIRRCAAKLFP